MGLADRALEGCRRGDDRVHEVAYYLAMQVAIRVLKTIYENDREIAGWKAEVERLQALVAEFVALHPTTRTITIPGEKL